MREEKNWYVVCTKQKSEKKVADLLDKKQMAAYLPETTKIQYVFGRKRAVPSPLLPSLVFVFSTEQELSKVIATEGVSGILYRLHKPAVIRSREIVAMQRFLVAHTDVMIEKVPLGYKSDAVTATLQHNEFANEQLTTEKIYLPSLGYCLTGVTEAVLLNNVA